MKLARRRSFVGWVAAAGALACAPDPGDPPMFGDGNNIATVEDRGTECAVPELPNHLNLREQPLLPDPFRSMDGTRITAKEDWICRRAEISAQVQEYELGPKPPPPERVSAAVSGNTVTVTVEDAGRSVSFSATLRPPATGTPPYPFMVTLGGGTGLDAGNTISGLGVAMVELDHEAIAEQVNAGSRGRGKFYELYPDHPAGALMAWAWGTSRLIDAIERTPETNLDPRRVAVTGCSRNGKGALVVGAFDERIALTLPQESGAGGSALWRLADVHQQAWIDGGMVPDYGAVQTLGQIVGENVWFRDSFRLFADKATRLPYDHHMVMGLVAPRALLVIDNTDQYWLDRVGSHFGAVAAHDIWQALGIPSNMGASQVGGHPHCSGVPQAQLDEVAAFVGKFLVGGGTAPTDVLYTDGNFPDQRSPWTDWDVPALE